MTTMFDERENAFERRFAHEEELRFRARMRRNRLLAIWACERMRLSGERAADYVISFTGTAIITDDEALVARLHADLRATGVEEMLPVLHKEMERCAALARSEQGVGLALDQGSSA